MKTILYDTITQSFVGNARNGNYLIDGKKPILPSGLIELEIVDSYEPINTDTQEYNREQVVDVEQQKLINRYYGVNKVVLSIVPQSVFARNLRLALIGAGVSMASINSMINSIENEQERETVSTYWEFSNEIYRDHPLLLQFASQLGFTSDQIDQLFIVANSIS